MFGRPWTVKPQGPKPTCRAKDRDKLFNKWFKKLVAIANDDPFFPLDAPKPSEWKWDREYWYDVWSDGYTQFEAYYNYRLLTPWIHSGY